VRVRVSSVAPYFSTKLTWWKRLPEEQKGLVRSQESRPDTVCEIKYKVHIFSHFTNIEHIKNDQAFNQSLDKVLEEFSKIQPECETKTGDAITTCGDNSVFYNIEKYHLVIQWAENTLSAYFSQRHIENFEYRFIRTWCNRIFKGCRGRLHDHYYGIENTLSLVLYYQIPENSSKYVVVDGRKKTDSYLDYDIEDVIILDVKEGLGICHSTKYFHDVTEHRSDIPRTVFVFDVEYRI
jgi:hypothetical protein